MGQRYPTPDPAPKEAADIRKDMTFSHTVSEGTALTWYYHPSPRVDVR